MRKRWKIKRACIILLLLAAAGGVMWAVFAPRTTIEPAYEGRTLSQWLEGHVPTSSANPPYNSPGWHKADEAIRHIGTNGLPTLLEMIAAKNPPRPIIKAREWAQRRGLITKRYRYAFQRNEEAEYAFQVLGTNAAGAVPGLIRIYQARRSPSSQRCAAQALASIGSPATAAIPALLRDFTHTNDEVRLHAVSAASRIGGDPLILVPAFRSLLKDHYVWVRWSAANGLFTLGKDARPAVPDLFEALQDQSIREPVEAALWRIAPEKVSNAIVVEDPTPIISNGRTTAAMVTVFEGERHTWIRPGPAVPCTFQFYSSAPRRLRLYRSTAETNDHFLGEFEIPEIPPSPATANVSLMCVIADQTIFLCARDNNRKAFINVKRVVDK